MFRKSYIGSHGFSTFVRGVWRVIGGEHQVLVTATGRDDDEFVPGNLYTLDEIAGITEGDVFAYSEQAERYAVA